MNTFRACFDMIHTDNFDDSHSRLNACDDARGSLKTDKSSIFYLLPALPAYYFMKETC